MDIEYFLTNKAIKIHIDDGIEYYSNHYGYRSRTADPIAGNYGIAAGCSITYGQSIQEEHRFSNLIEKEISVPIINLGIPGGGIANIYHNLVYMLAVTPKKLHPKFLIAQTDWEMTRLSVLAGEESMSFNIHAPKIVLGPDKIASMNKFYLNKIHVLCRLHNITLVTWKAGKDYIDQGLDNSHPGPEQNLYWSKCLIRDLNRSLL